MTSADPAGGAGPLVLLPGMNCSATLWSRLELPADAVRARLSESTLEAQIERLLDELPGRFGLAGLSLGATVAMAVVRRAPERVSSLTLMSTNPYGPTPAQLQAWQSARDALARGCSARQLQTDWLPNLLSPEVMANRPELVELTLQMADEVGEAELDAQLAMQATRIDERPGLRDVECPVTLIAAGNDVLCPVARHEELAEIIPGARLKVILDCAHLSPLEQPGLIALKSPDER